MGYVSADEAVLSISSHVITRVLVYISELRRVLIFSLHLQCAYQANNDDALYRYCFDLDLFHQQA